MKLINIHRLPLVLVLMLLVTMSCQLKKKSEHLSHPISNTNVTIVGDMKNVMWKGELSGRIYLDTMSNKEGLYGLGPESYLTGELLVNNGVSYLSKVISDSSMNVERQFDVSAPFFVYSNVNAWQHVKLPSNIKTIKDLEKFIDTLRADFQNPFVFRLTGQVKDATIHIQNLPFDTKVSSPEEAHQGQINYDITNVESEIIGFFSTKHKGIFTHHDSYLHMHLITLDQRQMGHLDTLEIGNMTLYLPKE